jgi:3-oxoadipate enol-lactonase
MAGPPVDSRLNGLVAAPIVVVDYDASSPPENGSIIASRIPGAQLVLVPNANHILTTDQPEQLSRMLLDWLDSNR